MEWQQAKPHCLPPLSYQLPNTDCVIGEAKGMGRTGIGKHVMMISLQCRALKVDK